MKKILMIFMVLVLALSFIGCAEEDNVPTDEDYMTLIIGWGAFLEVEFDALMNNGDVTGDINYTNSTMSVTGPYTYDSGDETYTLDLVLTAYQFNDGINDYIVSGTIINAYSDFEYFDTYVGSFSYGDYTIETDMSATITGFTGTFTINGTEFPANGLMDFLLSKSASKVAQKFLKK